MEVKLIVLLCFVLLNGVNSYKILGLFPMNSYSHYIQGKVLFEALAEQGHEVTMIAPHKEISTPENYTHIFIDKMDLTANKDRFYEYDHLDTFTQMREINQMGLVFTKHILEHAEVKKLLASDREFDLIIMDIFLNEAFFGFVHHYNAKVILISTLMSSTWNNYIFANPAPTSFIPSFFFNFTSEMTFTQRLNNFCTVLGEELYRSLIILPKQNEMLQKYFPGAPKMYDLIYQSSLILVNSHVSINDPMPLMPNMIEVAGYHIKPTELPKDLQMFLDDSRESGVIYFAMGSNLKSNELAVETRNALLDAFAKIPQKVLWKFESDIDNLPSNVKISKWLPQQAILKHSSVKAFISHGGLMSTIEAVYFGVPIIGIPIFADQKMNIGIAKQRGYAISVPLKEITADKMLWALNEVINNTKYRDNIQYRSKIMNDRVVKPIEHAVYWVEYVLRYQGAHHFQSTAVNLYWYQYYSVDILLFITTTFSLCLLIAYFMLKYTLQYFNHSKKVKLH